MPTNSTVGDTGTLKLSLANGAASSNTIAITDTTTPVTYSITNSGTSNTITEGQSVTFTISTTGVAAGSQLAYTLAGTGNAAGQTTNSGLVTIDATGRGVVSVAVPANSTFGDTGTLKLSLANGAASSNTITVSDTTPPPSFSLTTGIDNFVGTTGTNVFNATSTTLTGLDNLDGGADNDILNVADVLAITTPASAVIKNIETANITSGVNVVADTSKWTGLNNLNVVANDTAGANTTLTSATTTAVSLTDVVSGAGGGTAALVGGGSVTANVSGSSTTITVDGAAGAVNVTQATAGAVTLGGTTANAGSVTILDAAQVGNDITVKGGTDVRVTNTVTGGAGKVLVGADGNVKASITTAVTGAVNINETLNLTTTSTGGLIQVGGGTSVNVSINASAKSDGSTTTTTGATTILGTANTSSVTYSGTKIGTATTAVAGSNESSSALFTALTANESVTVGGLTYRATAENTATEVATAFALLANGATAGTSTKGTFSGSLSGWRSAAVSGGGNDTVVFTSTTAKTNVTDLASSALFVGALAGVTLTPTQGVAAAAAIQGIVNGTLTVTDGGYAAGAAITANTITSVTASDFGALTISDNNLTSLSLTRGLGGVGADTTINDASARLVKTTALNLSLNGMGAAKIIDAGNVYKTLSVSTNGADSALTGIQATSVTDLSLSGSNILTLTKGTDATYLSGLKNVTVTGTASLVDNGLMSLASGGSFNASGTSGAITLISFDAKTATYLGGSGVDTVTAASAISKAIDLGDGNDVFTMAAGVTTLGATLKGGAGNDTLIMVAADAATAATDAGFVQNLSGFETLKLTGGTGAQSVNLAFMSTNNTFNQSVDVAGEAVAGNLTLANFASGALTGTLAISGANAGTITVTGQNVTGTTDTLKIVQGDASGGTVAAAGYETVNLTSSATGGTITITDAALKSIFIDGAQSDTVTLSSTAVTLFESGNSTGGVSITSLTTAGAVTMNGGSGNDTLTAAAGTNAHTISGGAGNDTLVSNAGADTLTGGAGNDTFQISGPGANLNTYSTITDASRGDVVQFQGAAVGKQVFTSAKVTLASTASFSDYANAVVVAGGDASVNAKLGWFQYGGDTYVVESLHNATAVGAAQFTDGTDIIVKLTGSVDLANSALLNGATHKLVIL